MEEPVPGDQPSLSLGVVGQHLKRNELEQEEKRGLPWMTQSPSAAVPTWAPIGELLRQAHK